MPTRKPARRPAYERHTVPIEGRTILAMTGEEQSHPSRTGAGRLSSPARIPRLMDKALVPIANGLIDAFQGRDHADMQPSSPASIRSASSATRCRSRSRTRRTSSRVFMMLRYFSAAGGVAGRPRQARRLCAAHHLPRAARTRARISSHAYPGEVEGHRLTGPDPHLRAVLYPAGAETTFLAISGHDVRILTNPPVLARLRAHRKTADGGSRNRCGRPGAWRSCRAIRKRTSPSAASTFGDSWLLYGSGPSGHDGMHRRSESFLLDRESNRHLAFRQGSAPLPGRHLGSRRDARRAVAAARPAAGTAPGGGRQADRHRRHMRGAYRLPVTFDRVLPAIEYRDL